MNSMVLRRARKSPKSPTKLSAKPLSTRSFIVTTSRRGHRILYREEWIVVCAPSSARIAHDGVPPTWSLAMLGPLRGGHYTWVSWAGTANKKPRLSAGLDLHFRYGLVVHPAHAAHRMLRILYREEWIVVCAPSFARIAHDGVPPPWPRQGAAPSGSAIPHGRNGPVVFISIQGGRPSRDALRFIQ